MALSDLVITKTNDLPIRHSGEVHNGKVRSVYWLNGKDSKRIGEKYGIGDYPPLGVMVISDRISAFECIWQSESGLKGVPGKGAALNAISHYWFKRFDGEGVAENHIVDSPHPLVWIVQKAEPILIEAIARQYITGSMWRDYSKKNVRDFCGIELPEGLKENQRLEELLITPTTKGIIRGIPGIPEKDDVNISKEQIKSNYRAFGLKSAEEIAVCEYILRRGFKTISNELEKIGKIFVDTKFEFGYLSDKRGNMVMICIDEIGTPDSSRYWDADKYQQGKVVEESKEAFRQILLNGVPDRDVLLNKNRMAERVQLAETYRLKDEEMMAVSSLYKSLAEQITAQPFPKIQNAREEIIESLTPLGIIE